MTDKVQKIREEVERLKEWQPIATPSLNKLLSLLDTMQEEPVSMWHDVSEEPKPNMELICVGQYGNPLVLSSNSDSFRSRDISNWAYFSDLLTLSNVRRTVKDWKEPVSEELHTFAKEYAGNITDKIGYNLQLRRAVVYGAKWKEEQIMKDATDAELLEGHLIRQKGFTHPLHVGDKVKVIIIKSE